MKRATALLIVLVLAAGTAFAQNSSEDKLRFGVVVTDEHGAPIRDLKAADFSIESSGIVQALEMRSIPKAGEPKPTPDGEFTNRNHGTLGRGLVVIVLDTMHTRWLDEKDMRPMVAKYLASLAKRNTPVSLLIMDQSGVLHTVHEFTTSSATLASALDRADAIVHKRPVAGEASSEVDAETQRLADFLKGTIANQTAYAVPLRGSPDAVLQAFQGIAGAMAAIPGRKSLIWITNASPFEVEEKTHLMVPLSLMASGDPTYGTSTNAAGISMGGFNSVERRESLNSDEVKKARPLWMAAFSQLQRAGVALYPIGTRASAEAPFDPQGLHAISEIAQMTGGRELHIVGDPFPQLADLGDQNLAAYDLAAALPQNCKFDWCDVKITVKRPGAKVLAPSGFFRGVTIKPEDVVNSALTTPLGFAGLSFMVHFAEVQPAGANKKIRFVVTFPPDSEVPAQGTSDLNLEIVARAIAPTGKYVSQVFNASAQLPAASAAQAREYGFALDNTLELAPGEYVVRFLVRDKNTGRMGSISAPLKVS